MPRHNRSVYNKNLMKLHDEVIAHPGRHVYEGHTNFPPPPIIPQSMAAPRWHPVPAPLSPWGTTTFAYPPSFRDMELQYNPLTYLPSQYGHMQSTSEPFRKMPHYFPPTVMPTEMHSQQGMGRLFTKEMYQPVLSDSMSHLKTLSNIPPDHFLLPPLGDSPIGVYNSNPYGLPEKWYSPYYQNSGLPLKQFQPDHIFGKGASRRQVRRRRR